MASLPPRKISNSGKSCKQDVTPLHILLQMGFPKHRALKALAATGNRSVQLASDWLLTHVNDSTLDAEAPREYILYACPTGQLLQQLQEFWIKSKNMCGWNGAHNFPPHITLVSFFKAPDDCSLQLAKTLKQVMESVDEPPDNFMKLEPYISQNFMGLFVCAEHADYLKQIALQYVKQVSSAIGLTVDTYEHLDALATCFPWCALPQERPEPSICLEPHVKSLQITLAYQFPISVYPTLKTLVEELQPLGTSHWELRLYSRDPRLATHQVHKVTHEYEPAESDELQLVLGDYVYIDENNLNNSPDGWTHGISWLTGVNGHLPAVYVERTAESDAWTLHKAIALSTDNAGTTDKSDTESATEAETMAGAERGNAAATDGGEIGKAMSDESFREWDHYLTKLMKSPDLNKTAFDAGDAPATGSESKTDGLQKREVGEGGSDKRWVFALRHGERVDFTYGSWVPFCFDENDTYERKDLNMPLRLGKRAGGAEAYRLDGPLTRVGWLQARLVGEGLRTAGISLSHVYSSPALRCIETAQGLLQGLNLPLKIKVEPCLFEWTKWHIHKLPTFMTLTELADAGYDVDLDYKPLQSVNEHPFTGGVEEGCAEFYDRNARVVRHVLNDTSITGNVIFVGHSVTLGTVWHGLRGADSSSVERVNLRYVTRVSYASLAAFTGTPWTITKPPCPSMMNSSNGRFDWKILQDL